MNKKPFELDKKEIFITSNQIKQAIDLLVNENEILQDFVYKYQEKINKAIEYIKENFDKTGICVSGSDLPYSYIEELLELLGDKENE